MADSCLFLEEPELAFRFGQAMIDPHDGLSLFGPYDADSASHPKNVSYAVVGTRNAISGLEHWSELVNRPVLTDPGLRIDLWPNYPGFEACFSSVWPTRAAWAYEIDAEELHEASTNLDPSKRAFDVVNKYLAGIKIAKKRDESFSVFVCIVPDEVWRNCRELSKVSEGIGTRPSRAEVNSRRHGQGLLFEDYDPEQYRLSVDFRRQLKARAMEHRTPIQIIRESTLSTIKSAEDAHRRLTPFSDRAWNLSTTLYFMRNANPALLFSLSLLSSCNKYPLYARRPKQSYLARRKNGENV